MPLSDLFSPLKRQFPVFTIILLIVSLGVYTALQLLPNTQKTTIYYSLKPVITQQASPTFDHAESTMKMAEAVAGWAKNPQFRADVATEAGIVIKNFKRKLAARKQNYVNVFWTLKLQDQEITHRDKVVAALLNQIEARFADLNENSRAPYAMTTPEVFSENQSLPAWVLIWVSLILGISFATLISYLKESIGGKTSFLIQLKVLFPENPLLAMPEKLGQHDKKLLEQFILTFESPRLIGTFPASEKFFTLSPADTINPNSDTPILLVKLGETPLHELKNLKAIFGDKLGLIVFHQ